MSRIGRGRRDERGRGPGFVDPFLEQLTLGGFFVLHQHLVVHGLVELPFGVVNAELGKQRVHTERAGFVGDDGDNPLAEGLVLHQRPEHPNERHGG